MYKTFTITITMPMSWYSQNAKSVRRWMTTVRNSLVAAFTTTKIVVDIKEDPDPTEMEIDDAITDLTKVTGYKG